MTPLASIGIGVTAPMKSVGDSGERAGERGERREESEGARFADVPAKSSIVIPL
jgi:hypothetical protein